MASNGGAHNLPGRRYKERLGAQITDIIHRQIKKATKIIKVYINSNKRQYIKYCLFYWYSKKFMFTFKNLYGIIFSEIEKY